MNKLLLSLFLILGTTAIFAQTYERGEILISPGITVGVHDRYAGVGFGIPVVLNADFLVHEYVSVGPFLGFASLEHKSDKRFMGYDFGARGSFHFWSFIDDRVDADLRSEDFDIYGVVHVGYSVNNARKLDGNSGVQTNRFVTGPMLGARWYFAPQFAVFAEAGYGSWGLLNAGLTIRL